MRDFLWEAGMNPDLAYQEYATVITANILKAFCSDIMDAKSGDLNFRYVSTDGGEAEYLLEEECEGLPPYNPNHGFIASIGYDPKEKFFVNIGAGYVEELLTVPYPEDYPDSDPQVVEEVAKAVRDTYTDNFIQLGMEMMGGTGGDVWVDSADQLEVREGTEERIYKEAKRALQLIDGTIKSRKFRSEKENSIGDRESTLYRVKNDYYGIIICELLEENDKAYYFLFKDGDKVILPKWRVLKSSGRVLGRVSGQEAVEHINYYPGKEIQTESGQWFMVKELSQVVSDISLYIDGAFNMGNNPVSCAVYYGNHKVFSMTDGEVDEYSNTPFRSRGAKGAYFLWGPMGDESGDIAGNAFVSLYDGETPYDPAIDSKTTQWTADFRD